MSSQQYQNPVYENGDSEDPAHIAAGKVLQEHEMKKGQIVTKIPLVFKLLLLLVAAIAIVALVCSLLFFTGEVIPASLTSTPKQGEAKTTFETMLLYAASL